MSRQLLTVEPQILNFKIDPCSNMIEKEPTKMRLINPTTNTVLFKIKVNAPKLFCVRPCSGILEPHAKIDVKITAPRLALEHDDRLKYKFMVQSAVAPKDMNDDIAEAFNKLSPDEIMDFKLRCVFKESNGSDLNKSEDETGQYEDAKKRGTKGDDVTLQDSAEAINQTEANGSNDNHKSGSVIPNPSSTLLNTEGDTLKICSEVLLLREKEIKLRHENLQMKEELVSLRTVHRRHSYGPETGAQGMFMPWLAVAMALLGVIIGKFYL